jgi:CRP-like cAMP-binding protein
VFGEGAEGDALYIISQGAASVRLHLDAEESDIRLITFSAGTLFGEMALLDRDRRSATVIADEPLSCYVLERERFERLLVEHSRIGQQLLSNIARELSLRMRRANRTLASLV